MMSYSTFTDEELAKKSSLGEQRAFSELSRRFDAMLRGILSGISIDLSEKEDLYQEGLIGLYKACLAYDKERGSSFSTYAYICAKHNIYSSIRVYFSKKNDLVRISSPIDEVPVQLCPDLQTEPQKSLIEKESAKLFTKSVSDILSSYEKAVLKLFLKGLSYEDIATNLSVSAKSVDNALQRIRGKLKKFIK